MSLTRLNPPMEYMQVASRASLQNFELARLNQAAHLRREIAVLLDQWVEQSSEALLARWMLDHYEALHEQQLSPEELARALQEAAVSPVPDILGTPVTIPPAPPRFARCQADAPAQVRK